MMVKVICWDLDYTLGNFDSVSAILTHNALPERLREQHTIVIKEPITRRHNIQQTLTRLSKAGYQHVITTSATREYAREALRITGLASQFTTIFDRDGTNPNLLTPGKRYLSVIEQLGVKNPRANMIVVGDAYGDIPYDTKNMVAIIEEAAYRHDARGVERVITALAEKGGFYKGFLDAKAGGITIPKVDIRCKYEERQFNMGPTPVLELSVPRKFWKEPDIIEYKP
jgi:hypothetical protein